MSGGDLAMIVQPSILTKYRGINLWDEQWEIGDINVENGQKRNVTDRTVSKNFVPVLPNTKYFITSTEINTTVCFYGRNKEWVSSEYGEGYVGGRYVEFTTPSWCYYVMFYYNGTTYNNNISINYPSTETAYHPYWTQGLPEGLGIVDMGTLNWGRYTYGQTSTFRCRYNPSDMKKPTTSDKSGQILVGQYDVVPALDMYNTTMDKVIGLHHSAQGLLVADSDYSTVASFIDAINGVMLIYKKI